MGWRRALAARASRRVSAGLWRVCRAAQVREQVRTAPAHPGRSPPLGRQGRLPGEAQVGHGVTRHTELDRGQDHEPRPAVSGSGCAQFGRRPAQRLLAEAQGVRKRATGKRRPPDLRSIGWGGPSPPKPARRWRCGGPRQTLDLAPDQGPTDEWPGSAGAARRLVMRRRLPPAPSPETDLSVVGIGHAPGRGWGRPGRWIVTDKRQARSLDRHRQTAGQVDAVVPCGVGVWDRRSSTAPPANARGDRPADPSGPG